MELMLISKSDFAPYRAISANINDTKRLEPFILEAQRLDLMPLLGEGLYFNLIKNIASYRAGIAAQTEEVPYVPTATETMFLKLLNGETYTKDGIDVIYLGIVPVLCYQTYARFVRNDNIFSTPSGFVKKSTDFSEQISDKAVREMSSRAEGDARQFFEYVEAYLSNYKDNFAPYWGGDTCCEDSPLSDARHLLGIGCNRSSGRTLMGVGGRKGIIVNRRRYL